MRTVSHCMTSHSSAKVMVPKRFFFLSAVNPNGRRRARKSPFHKQCEVGPLPPTSFHAAQGIFNMTQRLSKCPISAAGEKEVVEDDALSHKTLAVAADRLHPTAAAAAVVHVSRVKRGGGDWCGRLFADFIATELGPLKPKPPTQLQLLIYSSAKHISLTSAFSSTFFPLFN
jgi:hypothetical protein